MVVKMVAWLAILILKLPVMEIEEVSQQILAWIVSLIQIEKIR